MYLRCRACWTNRGDCRFRAPAAKCRELVQKKLKAHGYCVYYLSNIPEDVLSPPMERDFQGLFDGGVASCEVHVNKPDPRIYQALLDKYGLKASESVFIDDRQDNVQAAFELGFVGIRMKDSVGTLVRSLATCNVAGAVTSHRFVSAKSPPGLCEKGSAGIFCAGGVTFSRSSGSSAGYPPAGWSRCSVPSP